MSRNTILVVDDTLDLLDLYSNWLRDAGYRVLQAPSGEDCLQIVVNDVPDLIVLDVMLPDLSGRDVCRLLKLNPVTAMIPVIHISGMLTSAVHEAEGLEAGADGYLTKPFEARTLLAHVKALLRIGRVETALRETHLELEKRVDQRTAELVAANAFLKNEIRDRKQAEETRNQLMKQLVFAQEAERKRLSRELHDQMGQSLAALMLGLKTLEDEATPRDPAISQLRKLQTLTNELAQEVHTLASDLRPIALDDFGLETALLNYVEDWSKRSKVEVDFHSNGLIRRRLPAPVETAAYRIVQEALTNVLKHSQAQNVSVILEYRFNRLQIIVEDTGCGFDSEALVVKPAISRRLGLLGMEERVASVCGTFDVESAPGAGTTVTVRIPVLEASLESNHN